MPVRHSATPEPGRRPAANGDVAGAGVDGQGRHLVGQDLASFDPRTGTRQGDRGSGAGQYDDTHSRGGDPARMVARPTQIGFRNG